MENPNNLEFKFYIYNTFKIYNNTPTTNNNNFILYKCYLYISLLP